MRFANRDRRASRRPFALESMESVARSAAAQEPAAMGKQTADGEDYKPGQTKELKRLIGTTEMDVLEAEARAGGDMV